MITITIAQLVIWGACDLSQRIASLCAHLGREVGDDEPVPLTVWAEVPHAGAPCTRADDLCWVLDRTAEGRRVLVALACDYAEAALPVWQKRHPDDSRPADCIAAVRAWLADPSPKRLAAVTSCNAAAVNAQCDAYRAAGGAFSAQYYAAEAAIMAARAATYAEGTLPSYLDEDVVSESSRDAANAASRCTASRSYTQQRGRLLARLQKGSL